MGMVVVLTITVVTPPLGGDATIGLLIAGQLAMGVAIDRYGWFGLDRVAAHVAKGARCAVTRRRALLALRR